MKKGIETRYIIHKILIILKTRPIGLDRIFAEKVEKLLFINIFLIRDLLINA